MYFFLFFILFFILLITIYKYFWYKIVIKGNKLLSKKRNLMIVAHPDDESLFGGHLLKSEDWKVICVTNASNSKRRAEFTNVMNYTNNDYEMWNYKDNYKYNFGGYENELKHQIRDYIKNNKYDTILTHNPCGEYGHSQHKMISLMVTEAVADYLKKKDILYYFCLTKVGISKVLKSKKHTQHIYIPKCCDNLLESEIKFKNNLLTFYKSQEHIFKKVHIKIYITEGSICKAFN